MCEADVYVMRGGREETLMERVDRIIPGEDGSLFLESVFGERKIIQARIREMELVRHRIILEEIFERKEAAATEIWLEPATDHGHFHAGEEVTIRLEAGYNMKTAPAGLEGVKVFSVNEDGSRKELVVEEYPEGRMINVGHEVDGLLQVFAEQCSEKALYAKVQMEIGHHHHYGVKPIGLPLEIVPAQNSHPRLGETYEVQVLKNGQPWPGAEVKATYANSRNPGYPHCMLADAEGKARIFLTARGNYLFKVEEEGVISTFTLVKSY